MHNTNIVRISTTFQFGADSITKSLIATKYSKYHQQQYHQS